MTDRTESVRLVSRAGDRVRAAANQWSASDLAEIGDCTLALELCASDLQAVLGLLRQQAAPSPGPMRAEMMEMKKNLGHLERLVDASASFLRNLPGGTCGATYRAGGSLWLPMQPAERGIEA